MKPYIWPSEGGDAPEAHSTRRTFSRQYRQNHGTLNLFNPNYYKPTAVDDPFRPSAASSRSSSSGRRHYHNVESTQTCEFPSAGIRRVRLPSHPEIPQGIRQLPEAQGATQHIQVVNITPAYKDPAQMEQARPGVRCVKAKTASGDVRAALAFAGTRQQLTARSINVPVGKPRLDNRRLVNYTNQERFAQVVRDHAQQRANGLAGFYVQLVRNAVGGTTPSTPRPQSVPWSLEGRHSNAPLTLQRCRDQLVSLTCIPVSLLEVADLLWDVEEYKARTEDWDEAAELGDRVVIFKDFASTFGENSDCGKLATMKI